MSTISSSIRTYPRALGILLAIGLLIRLAFVLSYTRPLISDEKDYDQLAIGLATSGSYAVDGMPTAYRPVGYPLLVGTVYLVCGHSVLIVKCLQAVIDTGTAYLIFLLLAGCTDRVRLIGSGVWVFFIPAILYTNVLMSESLFTFLLLLALLLLVQERNVKPGWQLLVGVVFGILVLMKPGLVLFLIAVPLFYKPLGLSIRKAILAAIAFAVVVAPWMMRNYAQFGEISPSSNGGINLLIGNNPHATGAYGITYDPAILQGSRSEFDADRRALQYATKYIIAEPATFAVNAVKKFGRLFESEGGILVLSFHRDPEDVSSHYVSKYASIPIALVLLTNVPYFALLIAAVFGFLGAPRDKFWMLTGILFISWVLLHIVFFGGGRFHFPLMPFVVVFAALALTNGEMSFTRLSKLQKASGLVVSLMLIALWVIEGIVVYSA